MCPSRLTLTCREHIYTCDFGRMPFGEIGPNGESQPRHDGRRGDTLSRYVTDGEGKATLVDFDKTEPVSADFHAVSAGKI